jgi:hypothetical protein
MCDTGKIEYPTKTKAHRAARAAGYRLDRVYFCADCYAFHITRAELKVFKHATPPKSNGPKPFVPSAAKLRRKLIEAGRQIRAAEKALAKVEAKKARAEMLAAARQKQAELVHESELQAISEMIGRLRRC